MHPTMLRVTALASLFATSCALEVSNTDASPDARAVVDASPDARAVVDASPADASPVDAAPPRVAFAPCGEVGVSRIHRAVPANAGGIIGLATYGREVVLVSSSDGRILRRIDAHAGEVYDVAFSEDSATVFSWGEDGVLRAWNIGDGTLRWAAQHRDRASHHRARLAVRGQRVAVGGPPAEVFDARTGERLLTLDHPGVQHRMVLDTDGLEPGFVAIAPDGSSYAAAQGSTVYLFDAEGRLAARTLNGDLGAVSAAAYPAEVNGLTFSPDGDALLVASQRGYVVTSPGDRYPVARLYRVSDGVALSTLTASSSYGVSAAFSPDGARVVVSAGGRVEWSTVRGPEGWIATPAEPLRTPIAASDLIVDGAGRIVANAGSLAVRVYTPDDVDPLFDVTVGDLVGRVVALSPDGARMLRSTTRDDQLELWSLGASPQRARTMVHASPVADLSPDGTRVALALSAAIEEFSVDGSGGRIVAVAPTTVRALSYAPDGRSILEAHDSAGGGTERPSELIRWSLSGVREGEASAPGRIAQFRRTHRGDGWLSVGPSRASYRGPRGVDLWSAASLLRATLHAPNDGAGLDCADVNRDGSLLFMTEWLAPVHALRTADASVFPVDAGVRASRVAFSPVDDLLVRGGDLGDVVVSHPASLSAAVPLIAPCAGLGCAAPAGAIVRLVFSRDGATLAVSTNLGETRLFCRPR